jgi:hypothetical protein
MFESDKRTEISSCFMEYIGLLLCALAICVSVCVCVCILPLGCSH